MAVSMGEDGRVRNEGGGLGLRGWTGGLRA